MFVEIPGEIKLLTIPRVWRGYILLPRDDRYESGSSVHSDGKSLHPRDRMLLLQMEVTAQARNSCTVHLTRQIK